jgi:hypothetical protein
MDSRLEICHWVNVKPQVIPSVLFTAETNFTRSQQYRTVLCLWSWYFTLNCRKQLPKSFSLKIWVILRVDSWFDRHIPAMCDRQYLGYFSQFVTQCLSQQFPIRWIGRGGAPYWPPGSPDLNSLFCHAWTTLKPWHMHAKWTQRCRENVWECIY